jgi:hypothetical protein
MMPHLGVLSTINPEAAFNVLMKDCVVRAGTCIAPVGQIETGSDEAALTLSTAMPDGTTLEKTLPYGCVELIHLGEDQTVDMELKPHKELDVGMGNGNIVNATVEGGVVGVIIDTRGRPLTLPEQVKERKRKLIEWYTAIKAYPKAVLMDK